MPNESENGVVTLSCSHSVNETVTRLKKLLESKGVTLFAVIDHSGEAEKAGLAMPNTKLIIFGNPKAGTPLMLAAPTMALDLPLKILVWEDGAAKTWVSYNGAEFLAKRHGLTADLMGPLGGAAALAQQVAQ